MLIHRIWQLKTCLRTSESGDTPNDIISSGETQLKVESTRVST